MFLLGSKNPIGNLAHKLEMLVEGKLWLQVIVSLALGVIVGIILGPDLHLTSAGQAKIIGEWLALPGELFLRLIKMILIPLVFLSILRGLGGSDAAQLRSIGPRLVGYLLFTTVFSCSIGIFLATVLHPGSYVNIPQQNTIIGLEVIKEGDKVIVPHIMESLPSTALKIIPDNPLASAANEELLGIVIFALIIGLALNAQSNKKIKPILDITDGFLDVLMTIVKWAMILTPLAAFGLTARMVIQSGAAVLLGMGMYIATVLLGLLSLILLYSIIILIFKHKNPLRFLQAIAPVQLLAFSTSSSAAVMPYSIQTATEKLDVSPETSSIIVPLGATVNMDGTAVYQSIAMIFMAQVGGVELGIGQIILVVVTLVGSSIGTPGTPGVGVAILLTIAGNLGIPTGAHALLLGVDRLLDRFRTVVNVTGDLTACVLFGSKK
jgi:Na+/H+-dicarboxylate symporter